MVDSFDWLIRLIDSLIDGFYDVVVCICVFSWPPFEEDKICFVFVWIWIWKKQVRKSCQFTEDGRHHVPEFFFTSCGSMNEVSLSCLVSSDVINLWM